MVAFLFKNLCEKNQKETKIVLVATFFFEVWGF